MTKIEFKTWVEYIDKIYLTWNKGEEIKRCLLGLSEESGEFVGVFKKILRGDMQKKNITEEEMNIRKKHELGDLLYYLRLYIDLKRITVITVLKDDLSKENEIDVLLGLNSEATKVKSVFFQDNFLAYILGVIDYFNFDFKEIIEMNVEKLAKRQKKGTINGSGDNR
jgi:NTP pyrophosphatase (non-canonical NTP hydrolase)